MALVPAPLISGLGFVPQRRAIALQHAFCCECAASQVGFGASGQSQAFGASGWLVVVVLASPFGGPTFALQSSTGDSNLDLSSECP